MTEMEFLKVFNDIEDKFVDEELEGETEPLAPVTVNPNGAKNRFFWVKFAGIAAACAAVVGGLAYLKNNPNIVVNPSVTEGESSVQTAAPELGENSTLYQTKLNCNGNSYDVRVFLKEIDKEKSLNDENYIWGNAAMELSLKGEVLDTVEVYEYGQSANVYGGTPFDRETLGSDYFRVISMEQDVLAFISPNSELGDVTSDNNYGAILNARFFTVNKEGKIAAIVRYATEEEKAGEVGTSADGFITPHYFFFKITPDYDVEGNRLICHLDRQVTNPWWINGTLYEKGDIPLSFDFENYVLTCENDDYKYLIYYAKYFSDSIGKNITLLDGSFAKEEDIKELHPYDDNPETINFVTINSAFAVPFFTPMEGRTPGKTGDWIKLTAGDTIGGFTVVKAESTYLHPTGRYFPGGYVATVELKGNLSCTGTAEKAYGIDGTLYDDRVKITLDRESCEKLFSLSFVSELFNESFDEERIRFFLPVSDIDELYHALFVQNKELVRIKLEADSFTMRYTYETGNMFDGWSTMNLDGSDYSLEIDEGKNLMDGSAASNDEILSEDDKTYTVNSCFAVPFSAVNGSRQAGEKGEWIKLKEGDAFGDYTVESAESTYTKPLEGEIPPAYKSKVVLSGKLSCTGTAKIIPDPGGYDGLVELTLDEDCCQKLINLAPYLDSDLSDSPSQDRIYMWLTYKTKDYQPIIDRLYNQGEESVRVKLETEHFSLSYQYGSEYRYDEKVMLNSVGNEHSLEIIGN